MLRLYFMLSVRLFVSFCWVEKRRKATREPDKERSTAVARESLPASRVRTARPRPVTWSEAGLRSRERESSGGGRKKLHEGVGVGPSGVFMSGSGRSKRKTVRK
ncbi:hypothetical protein PAMP_018796 [Pampus punctatissimus]